MRPLVAIAALVLKEISRKKDFYVALILAGAILYYAANLEFYHVEKTSRYLLEIGLALALYLSLILTVTLAARQFPSEMSQRTCQMLLARPVRRIDFVLGKYLGSAAAGIASLSVFYGIVLFFAFSRTEALSWAAAGETYYLFALSLCIAAAMASALSYCLTTGAAITLSLLIFWLSQLFGAGLKAASQGMDPFNRTLSLAVYYALPHFEFFDMRQRFIHDWSPLTWDLVLFLSAYALLYSSLFILAAWLGFRRRKL